MEQGALWGDGDRATRYWIAVASADHVARGRAGGFMQVCHGKGGPLARLAGGDRVAYYSPVSVFGTPTPLRAFTAIGIVRDRAPYRADMGDGFVPWRRDVDWLDGGTAAIAPLLDTLPFTRGRRNWAYPLRFGLFAVSEDDMRLIAREMGAHLPE